MVSWQLVIAGLIGIVPAFLILYAAYGRYDGKFRDETLFLLFMAGLFLGFPVALLEALLFVNVSFVVLLLVVVGFPAFEQMMKTVVLNLPRFHGELVDSGWVTPEVEYPTYRAFWRACSSG